MAATHPVAEQADALQCDLTEGPCYAAVTHDRFVLVNDMAAADQFPNYGPKALGTTSSMTMHDTVLVEQDGPDVRVVYRAEFHPEGGTKLLTPLLPAALEVLGDSAAKQMEECLLRRAAPPRA